MYTLDNPTHAKRPQPTPTVSKKQATHGSVTEWPWTLAPRWRKVWRELWIYRARSLLVIITIAAGVTPLGAILTSQIMLDEDLNGRFKARVPASAMLFLDRPFDEEFVRAIRQMEGVVEAEGRADLFARFQTNEGEWRSIRLEAFRDYADIRLNRIVHEAGNWPPPKRGLLLERDALAVTGFDVGDTLLIETGDGLQRHVKIAGLIHDLNKEPANMVRRAYGYVTFDTLAWFGRSQNFNQLQILVNSEDINQIKRVVQQVEAKIEKSGRSIGFTWLPQPGAHPASHILAPIAEISRTVSLFAVLMGSFLVGNIIAATLTQQTRQIGIMKSVGARTGQVFQLYLGLVLLFALFALLIALPVSALAGYGMASLLSKLLNFDLSGLRIPRQVIIYEFALGVGSTLLVALWPMIRSSRLTVHQAINYQEIGQRDYGHRLGEHFLTHIRILSRPLLLALRNSFRRRARLLLTMVALGLAGAMFITVFSVRSSLFQTLDELSGYWNYDVAVSLRRRYPGPQLAQKIAQIPAVTNVEGWAGNDAKRVRPDGWNSPPFDLLALPPTTQMFQPVLVAGRWLLPEDENAIVLDTEVLAEESDVQLGDTITLKLEERESDWRVVGIVKPTLSPSMLRSGKAYVNYPYYAQVAQLAGRVSSTRITTVPDKNLTAGQMAQRMETTLNESGVEVSNTNTSALIRSQIANQFNILTIFLAGIASVLAVVGTLGLMGTLSLNVLERAREIGVMRAIGASNGAIARMVIAEGIVIGALSWPLAVLLAYPVGKILSNIVGIQFTGLPLTYHFALDGAGYWLVGFSILSVVASLWPARKAASLPVWTVIAHE